MHHVLKTSWQGYRLHIPNHRALQDSPLFIYFFFFCCKWFTKHWKPLRNACTRQTDRYRKVSWALTWCRGCRRAVSGVSYLEASLFFSLRDRARATAGRSLTGPMPSMAALSFCSCSPMLWSFWGFGVRSLASVLRALRRPFLPGQRQTEGIQFLFFGFIFTTLINPPVLPINPKYAVQLCHQEQLCLFSFSLLINLLIFLINQLILSSIKGQIIVEKCSSQFPRDTKRSNSLILNHVLCDTVLDGGKMG